MTNETDKLERKPQPDIYCGVCLGYGVKMMRGNPFNNTMVQVECQTCNGSGWVKQK